MWPIKFMIKLENKVSKNHNRGAKSECVLAENKASCLFLIIMTSLDLFFLSSCMIPLITGWSSHLPSRRWSLRLPLFYPPLHSLISHQRPIGAHKNPGRLWWPGVTSVQVSSCAQGRRGARDEPKVTTRGEKKRVRWEKRFFFFFLKRWKLPPPACTHNAVQII